MLNDEFADEYEMDLEFDMETDMEFEASANLPFDEAEEMELAAELLEYGSDEELEYFLGKLAKRAGKFLKSKTARSIGRALKGVAKSTLKSALPMAGAAVGNVLMPGAGGAVGGKLGGWAASLFEMEFEGMSPEDMEFETARRIVRLAGTAGQRAAAMERKGAGRNAAKAAVVSAAKTHAPALLRRGRTSGARGSNSGRWVRKGNSIVLMGA